MENSGNRQQWKDFYERVGHKIGWDFSQLKVKTVGVGVDFYQEVSKQCQPNSVVLDIGVGSGERILPIADQVSQLVGIDSSHSMIRKAKETVASSDKQNVCFLNMDADQLEFPNECFDIVSCRQCGFSAAEVYRVLKERGLFFTQQVSEADKSNIKEFFGRGQAYGVADGTLQQLLITQLREIGFAQIHQIEYDITEYYQTPEDLLFLLKHTPILPEFGKDPKDFELFAEFVAKNQTEHGIATNAKRFVIVGKK